MNDKEKDKREETIELVDQMYYIKSIIESGKNRDSYKLLLKEKYDTFREMLSEGLDVLDTYDEEQIKKDISALNQMDIADKHYMVKNIIKETLFHVDSRIPYEAIEKSIMMTSSDELENARRLFRVHRYHKTKK